MFRRVIPAAILLISGIVLLVLAWPQLFRLEFTPGVAQVVALRGLGAVAAMILVILLTVIALLARPVRRFAASMALLLFLFAAVNVAVLSTRGLGNIAFETAGDSDVTVLTWNTLGDAPGAEAISELALEQGADVITLPETTEEMGVEVAELMKAAGRPMWVHTTAFDQVSKARSTTLLISSDLGTYSRNTEVGSTSVLPSVVATPDDGTGPTIIAVHPVAPIAGQLGNWNTDLGWLASVCAGDNIIMAGDFNSTIDHYARIAHADGATIGDCTDAGVLSGNGGVATWPTSLPALIGSPIDHVMVTDNWKVTGMRVIESRDDSGSDHRPVVVQLSPAG